MCRANLLGEDQTKPSKERVVLGPWPGLQDAERGRRPGLQPIYTSPNLSAVRRELLDSRCVPKVWQRNLHSYKALQTSDGTRVIEEDPLRGGIESFCRNAGIPFEGQRLGAAAHGALERLLRPKRGHTSAKLRREIVERQDG